MHLASIWLNYAASSLSLPYIGLRKTGDRLRLSSGAIPVQMQRGAINGIEPPICTPSVVSLAD